MPKRTPTRARSVRRAAPRRPVDQIPVSAGELTALYEELEALRSELARVGRLSSRRDYQLRAALAELEILKLRGGGRCPRCGRSG